MVTALGLAAFGLGATAVFATENGTGAAALIVFSGVALVVAVFGDRIDSLELGGANLRLRAAAAQKYALAEQSDERGDTAAGERLRGEARALMELAGAIAADYRSTRGAMPSGPARTAALDRLVERAADLARAGTSDPGRVRDWLRSADEERRVTALGMMQADPRLRDFEALPPLIEKPGSAFEQYHAMVLARLMLGDLDARQRERLLEALTAAEGERPMGPNRRRVADALFAELGRDRAEGRRAAQDG
ncbi:hypothetical protein HNR12_002766 [Streptomonospora nanhaiensis]|uniref:Uncharacterized protein n=1 Tax=Streptomonospora nanhaiensis TaxID=1323731 RepID=A0A853BLP7_9ACTN|nr:hypothetical protein [Streptomonospora nanhaiensis]NYI96489.1 hypothetical protein [Streptomonospora nanhaiensis]